MSDRALLLFTKPAVAGRVKTRLTEGGLSAEQAAALHAAFLADLVARFAEARLPLVPWWALEPRERLPEWPSAGLRQSDGDLGARLLYAFRSCAANSPAVRFAAAIGADCPDLPLAAVEGAFAALDEGADLAIVPAEDGGYALIAARPESVPPRLFEEIPWSGPQVLATTVARAAELGLDLRLLTPARDVDTVSDLCALAERLAAADPDHCPATRAALAAVGVPIPEVAPCAS